MEQYIGEMRIFAGNYAPQGWAFCDGQLLSVQDNEALFSLLGTTYGGDGRTSFALPDYRGRTAIGMGVNQQSGTTYYLGQKGGSETATLTTNELPSHTHTATASSEGISQSPSQNVWAKDDSLEHYSTDTPNSSMSSETISNEGGNLPHDNMMPFQVLNYIIALKGVYPTPS